MTATAGVREIKSPLQDVVHHACVLFDPRHVGRERRDAEIVDADGRGADEHDLVLERAVRRFPVQDVRNRKQGERPVGAAVIDKHAAFIVGGNDHVAKLYRAREVDGELFIFQSPVYAGGLRPMGA